MLHPGIHLAGRQAKWHGATEGKKGVPAGEVVRRGLRHFHGPVLNGINHAKRRHQFTGSMHRHFKLAARQGLHGFGKHFCTAENRVEGLGETGSHAPADCGLRMDCRRNAGSEDTSDASVFD
jgi:hypothetical protein